MKYIEGNEKYYIAGIPGNYAVKATGNNRIVLRCETIEEARTWLTN